MIGIVKFFDAKKGYGFIVSEKIEGDIMLHYSELVMEGFKTVRSGDKVEFELDEKRKEGLSALNVSIL